MSLICACYLYHPTPPSLFECPRLRLSANGSPHQALMEWAAQGPDVRDLGSPKDFIKL